MTKKEALKVVGGLSNPGKMPGFGFGLDPRDCPRGSSLSKLENSICSKCYAKKGRYVFPIVLQTRVERTKKMENPEWISAMTTLIKDEKWFRWFDSGDLHNVEMLEKIIKVCENTPKCRHWLATREFGILKKYVAGGGVLPKNLTVRISADYVGQMPASWANVPGCTFSTTGVSENLENGSDKIHNCPATHHKTKKTCDEHECKKCWNKNIKYVNYKTH